MVIHYTYIIPISNAEIADDFTHVDFVHVPDTPTRLGSLQLETLEYFNETSGLLVIRHDKHTTEILPGANGMITCHEDEGKTYMTFYQNRDVFERDGRKAHAKVHFAAETKTFVPCDFPDVAIHAYNTIESPAFSDQHIRRALEKWHNQIDAAR